MPRAPRGRYNIFHSKAKASVAAGGGAPFVPFTSTYNSGSGNEPIPVGATNVVITVWGGGAAGGYRNAAGIHGAGGGSGAKVVLNSSVLAGEWSTNLAYAVGAAVAGRSTAGTGSSGNNSTVTGTVGGSARNLSGGGGSGGPQLGTGGSGGPASGGTTNTNGNAGGNSQATGDGHGAGAPDGGGDVAYLGGNGTAPGGGGPGGDPDAGSSGGGAVGRITFDWT